EDLKSSVWHIDSRSTMTSTGRPDGAVKYICRSPFRLLNRLSGSQPALSRWSAILRRLLPRHARSISCPARSRGGEAGTQAPDPEAAEDLELVARLRRAPHQRGRLGQRVARGAIPEAARPVRCGHSRSLLVYPVPVRSW